MTFRAIVSNAGSKPSYQWRKNGVNILGATSSMLITSDIKERDVISVVVHSNLRCAMPDSAIASTWPLATNDINLSGNNVAVYPNPNAGDFIVKGTVPNTCEHVAIEIMNMLGAVVYSNVLPVSSGSFQETVRLDNIAKGVYVIRLKADNAVFFTKFTLQK